MVLDGGSCEIGLESTVVGFPDGRPALLRPTSARNHHGPTGGHDRCRSRGTSVLAEQVDVRVF